MGERAPWWSPPWVDGKVINWTYNQVMAWLTDIRATATRAGWCAVARMSVSQSITWL